MQIPATQQQPQQQQPQQQDQMDAEKERRLAVTRQALGIANKATSVSQPAQQSNIYSRGQNVKINQSQNTFRGGVGRRQPR
jgi:hypothetical protein